jgi:hypothetical protein
MGVSRKTLMGLALEGVAGTAESVPTVWVPAKSILKGTKKKERPDEERGDLDVVHDSILVQQEGAMDPKGAYYNDVHGYLWKMFFGNLTTSQPDATHAPTVYKHTFAWADVPPSATLWKSYDGFIRQGAYGTLEKMSLKFSADKLLEIEPTFKSNFPIPFTGTWTPVVSTLKPFSGYSPTVNLDAVLCKDITDFQLDLELEVTYFYASAGDPDYITVYFDGRKAELSFTARMDDPTKALERFENGDKSAVNFKFQGALIANSGGSGTPPDTDYFQELYIAVAQFDYDSAEEDTSKGNNMVKVKGVIESPTTNLSGYIQNTVVSY